ncbi:MAG TPA: Hpt domain-containing protein, partial [Polyangiales bacterium]|nr:Hpt domain-containing protein [Polyangiales bacterium]
MGEYDDVIAEFLVESREGLDQLDQDLVALEETPEDRDTLGRIFRCFHTIKGTSGFLGFGRLEQLTHAGENLLSKMRDGVLISNGSITSVLLETVDAVRKMLEIVESTSNDGAEDYSELTEKLHVLSRGEQVAASSIEPPPSAATATEDAWAVEPEPEPAPKPEAKIVQLPPAPMRAPVEAAPAAVSGEEHTEAKHGGVPENVRVDVSLL